MVMFSAFVLGSLAVFIMYTAVKVSQRPSRDSQGKMCALLIVIGCVGLFLIYSTHDKISDFGIFRQDQATMKEPSNDIEENDDGDDTLSFKAQVDANKKNYDDNTDNKEVEESIRQAALTPNKTYGIVFDAGSTGTRIHVFRLIGGTQGKPYEMEDELFKHVKPGLSSYADDPLKGSESVRDLLEEAKKYIPESQWKETPITLKATAGLRLLPPEKSQAILTEVESIIRTFPFKTTGQFVSIMDGTDEGVFSWFTVNFFKGTINNPLNTVGVMDLGGGSTQITFVPTAKATLDSTPADFFTTVKLTQDEMKLYTHSYLGLGLMSGRLQILGGKEGSDNPSVFTSPCFPSGFNATWDYGGHNFTIRGTDAEVSHSQACYTLARRMVDAYKVNQPTEVTSTHFVLISYYYDRAADAGLMDPGYEDFFFCEKPENLEDTCDNKAKGGEIKMADFITAATSACDNFNKATPFMCLDLSYIHALLKDGFGFHTDTDITVLKQIKGREISWGLGAMFQMLNMQQTAPPAR